MLGLFLFAALNVLANTAQMEAEREEDIRREELGYYENSYVTDAGVQLICDAMRESLAVAMARDSFLKMYGGFGMMSRTLPMMQRNGSNAFTGDFAVQWLMLAGYVQRRSEAMRLLELMVEKRLVKRVANGEYAFTGRRVQEPPPSYEAPAASSRAAITQSARAANVDATPNTTTTATSANSTGVTYTPLTQEEMDAAEMSASASASAALPPAYDEAVAASANAQVEAPVAVEESTSVPAQSAELANTAATVTTETRTPSTQPGQQQPQQEPPRNQQAQRRRQQQQQPRRRLDEEETFGGWFGNLISSIAREFDNSSPFGDENRKQSSSSSRRSAATPARRNTATSTSAPVASQSITDIVADTARAERARPVTPSAHSDAASSGIGRRSTAPATALMPPSYESIDLEAVGDTAGPSSASALPPPPPYVPS